VATLHGGKETKENDATFLIDAVSTQLRSGLDEGRSKVMPHLLSMLMHASRRQDAEVVEDILSACWRYHKDESLSFRLEQGTRLLEAGKVDQAFLCFDALVELDPGWAEARAKRATACFYRGEYESCLDDAEEVLKEEPSHFTALTGRGRALYELGDYGRAIEGFEEALRINPWNGVIVYSLQKAKAKQLADSGS